MCNNYFKTNASKRRYLLAQEETDLFKDAPTNLQDKYGCFIWAGDGCGEAYPYPLTFKEWLEN